MILLRSPQFDDLSPCPYLPEREKQYEYFFAHELNEEDTDHVLAQGWRKFGIHFFRPSCPGCNQCIPVRVLTKEFKPSRSQKRNLKKNVNVEVRFGPLIFTSRIYEIYSAHSAERFNQKADLENFLVGFYTPSCPSLQSEYYLDGQLIGVGFLDIGDNCLSSIYFFFDPAYSKLGIGTFSVLKEIEYAASMDLSYYYLGYYVPGCSRMSYKDTFRPREHFNWDTNCWKRADSGRM